MFYTGSNNQYLEWHTLNCSKLFDLSSTTYSTGEPTEGDRLLVLLDVAKVGIGLRQIHACRNQSTKSSRYKPLEHTRNSSSNLSHIFEVCAEVVTSRECSYNHRFIWIILFDKSVRKTYFFRHFWQGERKRNVLSSRS